jgi:hypothetical protein
MGNLSRPVRRGLRHEVAYVAVTTRRNEDVTQCSAIGILPGRAIRVI